MKIPRRKSLGVECLESRRVLNGAPVAEDNSYTTLEDELFVVGSVSDTTVGLVHRWTFDELSGDIAVDSISGNDGALVNWSPGETKWVTGRIGGALDFGDSNNYVLTQSATPLDRYTFSFWIRLNARHGINPRIITPRGAEWIMQNNESGRGIGFYSRQSDAQAPTEPVVGAWEHYAVLFDQANGTATVFRDGLQVGSDSVAKDVASLPWIMGHNQSLNNQSDSWNGLIDDMRIYDRLLNSAEIEALASATEISIISSVLDNDTDPDGDILTASLVEDVNHGMLQFNADGTYQYTPDDDFFGEDLFTYLAHDGQVDSNVATVTIDVQSVNDAPQAVEDGPFDMNEDSVLVVSAEEGVLTNDIDAESDPLSAILVGPPENGILSLSDDGSFEYTPAPRFQGADQFAYRASDGDQTSNIAVVTLNVLVVPDVPVARDDHFTVREDQRLVVENTLQQSIQQVTIPGETLRRLAYDTTREMLYVPIRASNTVVPINVNTGKKGEPIIVPGGPDEVVVTDNGQYLYVGADGSNSIVRVDLATNTIDQTISLGSNYAVDLDILPGQPESIAVAKNNSGGLEIFDNSIQRPQGDRRSDQSEINEDATTLYGFASSGSRDVKRFNLSANGLELVDTSDSLGGGGGFYYENGLLFFDSRKILDAETLTLLGSISGAFDSNVVPITHSNRVAYVTDQADTVEISDIATQQRVANIQVPGQPRAHHPISIGNDGIAFVGDEENIYLVRSDHISGVTRHDIMANDNDPEDDPLTLSLVETTQNGTLNLNPDGTFDYQPNPNFHGIDTFIYFVSDGQFVSNTATVTIEVEPVNDLPIATQDVYRFTELVPLSIGVEDGVLANDSDPDGTVLTAVLVSEPNDGSLTFQADGSFDYTPGPTFIVVDQFTYRASDGEGASAATTVTLTLSDSDQAPIAINDTFSAIEDTLLVISPDASDPPQVVVNEEFISVGSDWRYLDDGSNQGTAWTSPAYDDSDWASGAAELGYGDGDEATVVSYGLSSSNKHITTYFRHEFSVANANQVISLALSLKRDDGAAVYLNGVEIARDNLQPNAGYDSTAQSTAGDDGDDFLTFDEIDTGLLIHGTNVIAVEIHQQSGTSSDISFDLGLSGDVAKSTSVLENDFSPIGASITATLVNDADHGAVTLNTDGTFEYLPDVDFFGTDGFTYEATDGTHVSRVATATIEVSPVNDPPQAHDDLFRIGENQTLTVNAADGVLSNDVDVDSNDLIASMVDAPSNGNIDFQADGSFVYMPGPSFDLTDSFTYSVNDGSTDSEFATVVIELDVPHVELGEFYLRPNTPDQQILIYVSSETEVSGVNFFLQVGDGGPELADFGVQPGTDGPAIAAVDLKTSTIFESISDPQTDQPGIPQVATSTISISADGQSVLADGLLATVTIDTTGFFEGNWDLLLDDVLPFAVFSGPFTTDFAGIPAHITNGQLVIRQTEVTGRHVIYGGSSLEDSLATDKEPLFSGEPASFANYTSYSRGLNGLVIDVANLLAAPTLGDFEFRVGRNSNFSAWTAGPAPSEFAVTPGAGPDGADRVTIRWQDGDIYNNWLEVTMLPSAETGLVAKDVFYFGNAPGDTGDSTTNALVNATDVVDTRDNKKGPFNPAGIGDRYDFNRDGLVNATDVIFARDNITSPFTALQLITPESTPIPQAARVPRAPLQSRAVVVFAIGQDDTPRVRPSEEVPFEPADSGSNDSSEPTNPIDRRIANRKTTLARRTIREKIGDRLQHIAASDHVFAQDSQWRDGIWGE